MFYDVYKAILNVTSYYIIFGSKTSSSETTKELSNLNIIKEISYASSVKVGGRSRTLYHFLDLERLEVFAHKCHAIIIIHTQA